MAMMKPNCNLVSYIFATFTFGQAKGFGWNCITSTTRNTFGFFGYFGFYFLFFDQLYHHIRIRTQAFCDLSMFFYAKFLNPTNDKL